MNTNMIRHSILINVMKYGAGLTRAGETTASYAILSEILDCKEFIKACEIAKGILPFLPE